MNRYRVLRWALQIVIVFLASLLVAPYLEGLPLCMAHVFAVLIAAPFVFIQILFAEGYLHE